MSSSSDSLGQIEREVAGDEFVTRNALRVEMLEHEKKCDLKEKVDKLRMWVAGASVLGAIGLVAGPVWLAWWLSTRLPAPQQSRASETPSLINQAHAAPSKGQTP